MGLETLEINDIKENFATAIRLLAAEGHCPATSGNFALRTDVKSSEFLISESGVNKKTFSSDNFIEVNLKGEKVFDTPKKVSAETLLHCALLKNTQAGCVLHLHSLESLLFADLFVGNKKVEISGLELLKGLAGNTTHEDKTVIPILENTQDMIKLSAEIDELFSLYKGEGMHAFLIRGHGLNIWGRDLEEALRHFEVFQYLFKYTLAKKELRYENFAHISAEKTDALYSRRN